MHSLSRELPFIAAGALLGLAAAAPAAATNGNVNVGAPNGLSFSPATLNISAGDTGTFANGGGFHNAASDPARSAVTARSTVRRARACSARST